MSRPLIFVLLDCPAEYLGLSLPEKTVLTTLVSHLNPSRNGSEVWPSLARLAALSGAGERTVRRSLRKLQDLDLVKLRTDSGKTNVYTVNSELIQNLADPGQRVRGQAESYPQPRPESPGTPARESGDPGHCGPLTANRTAKVNSQGISTLGCSTNLTVSEPAKQRKLPIHQVIAEGVRSVTATDDEQPTEEKNDWQEDRRLALGALAAKERPG